jgi:hypothetical protein
LCEFARDEEAEASAALAGGEEGLEDAFSVARFDAWTAI